MSSTQRKVAQAFIDSFDKLDVEGNIALRTDDCTHTMAPASLGFPPTQNNEEWRAHFGNIKAVLDRFPVYTKEMFAEEGSNQVTIWATSEIVLKDGARGDGPDSDWEYHGEYMFVLLFKGDKISRIIEFVDSRSASGALLIVQRAKANLEANAK